jgi:hypothetical protein
MGLQSDDDVRQLQGRRGNAPTDSAARLRRQFVEKASSRRRSKRRSSKDLI